MDFLHKISIEDFYSKNYSYEEGGVKTQKDDFFEKIHNAIIEYDAFGYKDVIINFLLNDTNKNIVFLNCKLLIIGFKMFFDIRDNKTEKFKSLKVFSNLLEPKTTNMDLIRYYIYIRNLASNEEE